MQGPRWRPSSSLQLLMLLLALVAAVRASVGDRLPEFRECVEVCKKENCDIDDPTPIPFVHRLLLWTCPAECDYTCQHIVTSRRVASELPIVQFHGKWPFHRVMGMQEPFSVAFSLGNLLAHHSGLASLRASLPPSYPLRVYYERLAHLGLAAWFFSAVFHARDSLATEQLDYLAAGASVLYGLYMAPVRVFRLDRPSPRRRSVLRLWTALCALAYLGHVAYLKGVRWDYGYNMTANVIVGVLQNSLWTYFSYVTYMRTRSAWAVVPGLVVTWIMLAMSLELLDFPPLFGHVDAHSLWHLATIFPTVVWYNFLIKDAQDDIAAQRLKA